MKKEQKKLTVIIFAFILMFGISIVYALAAGVISFSGSAEFAAYSTVDLQIVGAQIINAKTGDTVNVSANGHTLSFSMVLASPGDYLDTEFYIKNVGNVTTQLGTLNTNVPASSSGIVITWPTGAIEGLVINPNTTAGPFIIRTAWSSSYPNASSDHAFSATILFSQY